MFWNKTSCSETWFHGLYYSITWNHVPQKHALCLRTWIMFWNMKSCSRKWFHVTNHVQAIVFGAEHGIMLQNMESCSELETWFHVLKLGMISSSCSDHVQPEHDFVMFEHVLNMPEHVLNIEHVQTCSGPWTWSEHGGHLVDVGQLVQEAVRLDIQTYRTF